MSELAQLTLGDSSSPMPKPLPLPLYPIPSFFLALSNYAFESGWRRRKRPRFNVPAIATERQAARQAAAQRAKFAKAAARAAEIRAAAALAADGAEEINGASTTAGRVDAF